MSHVSLERGPRFLSVPHFRSKPGVLTESPNGIMRVQEIALNSLTTGDIIPFFHNNDPKKEPNRSMVLTVLDAQDGETGRVVNFRCESIHASVRYAFRGVDGRQFELPDGSEVMIQSGFYSPRNMVHDRQQRLQEDNYGRMVAGEDYWFRFEKTLVAARNVSALYLGHDMRISSEAIIA